MIRRRHIFHIPGYDPIGAEWQHKRFKRELGIFSRTWNISATVSDLTNSPDRVGDYWSIQTQGAGWQVDSVFAPLLWDDIINGSLKRPLLQRLARSFAALADFIGAGAVFRY